MFMCFIFLFQQFGGNPNFTYHNKHKLLRNSQIESIQLITHLVIEKGLNFLRCVMKGKRREEIRRILQEDKTLDSQDKDGQTDGQTDIIQMQQIITVSKK